MRTTWRTAALVALAAMVIGTGACGGEQPASPPDPAAAARQRVIDDADAPCVSDRGQLVAIENAKHDLTAAWQTGQGETGVVLLHQADAGLCQWSSFAALVTGKGHRALAVDVDSRDAVEFAQAAVAHLRATGAKRVFVVGASRGGTIALAAAAGVTPPVNGVVSLSAPTVYDADARTAVAKLAVPVIIAAGANEARFADAARELHGLSVSTNKKLLLPASSYHGVGLLDDAMNTLLLAFLTDPAAATA
ncbi:alpha/beta hydrolase [Catellatospora paridis]|uniref:alpha/beta hydrolase n=1 Tax=Catellatospora paridis TaxID=1617086 RepID=UPI0012D39080|nr:alpha/beta fold hydrolase [Catellatospora paridis]